MLAADHDLVGIVTVHDGPSLPPGEIIAPEVGTDLRDDETFHNNFQEPEKFLAAGGYRGRQLQVIVEGTWYINRLFATVEAVPKTVIPVGNVGVVIFYTGPAGPTTSRASSIATANSCSTAAAASGRTRCCPANTRSTPMPARSRSSRPSTSS